METRWAYEGREVFTKTKEMVVEVPGQVEALGLRQLRPALHHDLLILRRVAAHSPRSTPAPFNVDFGGVTSFQKVRPYQYGGVVNVSITEEYHSQSTLAPLSAIVGHHMMERMLSGDPYR